MIVVSLALIVFENRYIAVMSFSNALGSLYYLRFCGVLLLVR